MNTNTEHQLNQLTVLVAGALGGFGEIVALGKCTPEKAAHKAVVMAESAISEMQSGDSLGSMGGQTTTVFEKPDR